MKNQVFRERECVHRDKASEGEFYNGSYYIKALQRLPVDRAMQVAGRVGSFFWSDAEHMLVWLCSDCADDLRMTEPARPLAQAAQPAQRQA